MSRRRLRALAALAVVVAALVFVLTSCPGHRDGMPGELASAKDDVQSAARSAALGLEQWQQKRTTQALVAVQLSDARDDVVTAYQGIAELRAEDPVDIDRQVTLTSAMTELLDAINAASASVRGLPGQSDAGLIRQRLLADVDALERDYR